MATVAVTDANFDAEVRKSSVPVVVDFWAEWCGPCKQIGPALEELATHYAGRVKIAKVNVDENPDLPAQFGVRGIPANTTVRPRWRCGTAASRFAGMQCRAHCTHARISATCRDCSSSSR